MAGLDPFLMIVALAAIALLPFAAMMVTSFTKMIIVLSLVRNALGLQQVPPGIVLNGLAMVLSFYVMYPVGIASWQAGSRHLPEGGEGVPVSALVTAVTEAKEPIKVFLHKHSRPQERSFFLGSADVVMGKEVAATLTERDFVVLIPAFVASELTEAFEIGFLIFLPFLVIDLLVASTLLALGMQMMAPTMVSLPFKLLLLVWLDGWTRLLHALVLTYR